MIELETEMARSFYGYGRWTAPYWFIGPEQGQGRNEMDSLAVRSRAWQNLNKPDLADLKSYHDQLEIGMWTRENTPLQATWRSLLLLLLTFKNSPTDVESRREYQRTSLGRVEGETCLAELSGFPANNSLVKRDRVVFLSERIDQLRAHLVTLKPTFVVMYGKGAKPQWEQLVDRPLEADTIARFHQTLVLFTSHPNTHGLKSEHWRNLGRQLSAAFNQNAMLTNA